MDRLKEIEYLTAEECESQKNVLLANIEKTTQDYIVIPEINPALLNDLNLFEPELYKEFVEIATEQKILHYMLANLMPKIFGYKPQ